jgi:RNA polymerase sigma-70 factor (ECF subfamily)
MRPGTSASTYDERLMSEFERGDVKAIGALFHRFAPMIYGIGVRTFRDRDRAAEHVECTFVRLWRQASRYASSSVALERWILLHALDVAVEMARAQVPGAQAASVQERAVDTAPVRTAIEPEAAMCCAGASGASS